MSVINQDVLFAIALLAIGVWMFIAIMRRGRVGWLNVLYWGSIVATLLGAAMVAGSFLGPRLNWTLPDSFVRLDLGTWNRCFWAGLFPLVIGLYIFVLFVCSLKEARE